MSKETEDMVRRIIKKDNVGAKDLLKSILKRKIKEKVKEDLKS